MFYWPKRPPPHLKGMRSVFAATTPPRMITLVILTGLSVLSLNMFLPSLSNMAVEFETEYSVMTLAIAGYLAITAVLMMIMGPLSDRYGRRPVLLLAVSIFTVSSLICALSTHIWVFLFFRVCQGAVIAGWAVSLAVIRDTTAPQEAASKIGYVTMAMAVAPMLGPMFGGVLDELFNWRASFFAYAGFGLLALALCWLDLGETNKTRSATFAQQFRSYPELFGSRRYWGYAICQAFSTGSFYVFIAGAPLIAVTLLGLTPAVLGFYLGTITAGFAFGSFISGRYARRFAITTMMIAGRVVGNFGVVAALALVALGHLNVGTLFGALVFVGIGNGLTMPSCNAGILSLRPALAGSAAGLAGALTIGGGALLTTLTGAVVIGNQGAYGLLFVLLFCTLMSMAGAFTVWVLDRKRAA